MPRFALNPLMYHNDWEDQILTTPGDFTVKIPKGIYQIVVRGAGGAGGSNSNRSGGAGGKGLLKSTFVTLAQQESATARVGAGGLTYANGGNGGSRGDSTDATNQPGHGGGGGHASVVFIGDDAYGANGGGGGGGAGGSDTSSSRYSDGASGGGGGGYYRLNTDGTETDIAGKKGGKGTVVT